MFCPGPRLDPCVIHELSSTHPFFEREGKPDRSDLPSDIFVPSRPKYPRRRTHGRTVRRVTNGVELSDGTQ